MFVLVFWFVLKLELADVSTMPFPVVNMRILRDGEAGIAILIKHSVAFKSGDL